MLRNAFLCGVLAAVLFSAHAVAGPLPITVTLNGLTDEYNALAFCKCDGRTLSDVTTTATSASVTSASYSFGAGDVGKFITIAGAGASGAVLNATISSVSAGTATLSVTAGTSIAGTALSTFGTDDSAAASTFVTSLSTAGGGTILLPVRTMVISSTIVWKSNVRMRGHGAGRSIIKWISPSAMTTAMIQGTTGTSTAPFTNIQFSDLEMDAEAATGSYIVAQKAFYFQYIVGPVFERLYVHGTPATGIGIDYLQNGRVVNNVIRNCGRLAATGSLGGSGIGIGTNSSAFSDGSIISGNTVYMPTTNFGNYGIFVESQNSQSVQTWNRITQNHVYLYGTNQKAFGDAAAFFTIFEGNQVVGNNAAGQRGISIDLGTVTTATADPYGKAIGNQIFGVDIGIYYDASGTAQYTPTPFTFENNNIQKSLRYGYYLHSGASIVADGIVISGGVISLSQSAAIFLDGTAGFKNLTINQVKAFRNGLGAPGATLQSGLAIATQVNGLMMADDWFYDDGGTFQLYGIVVNGVAVTNAFLHTNNLAGNVTAAVSLANAGTLSGRVQDNPGYNPQGTISVTPSASPWTYTAGNTPENLYLNGGTVSNVSKNGLTIATASPVDVPLAPGEAVIVTYSSAPTAVSDRK